jgi:hypothetical protein
MAGLFTGLNIDPSTLRSLTNYLGTPWRRAGANGETLSRTDITPAAITIVSGQQSFSGIYLPTGTVVTNITFTSNSTAAVTPTAQWASLYDANLNLLRTSADQTNGAWAANAEKVFVLSSTYTVLADAIFYLGVTVAAATPPTMSGLSGDVTLFGRAPAVAFTDSGHTGLTTPATAPAVATNSAGANLLYAYTS